MDDLSRIQAKLCETPISELPAVCEETGVPFGTLFKIKYGTTKYPRVDTVRKLVVWASAA